MELCEVLRWCWCVNVAVFGQSCSIAPVTFLTSRTRYLFEDCLPSILPAFGRSFINQKVSDESVVFNFQALFWVTKPASCTYLTVFRRTTRGGATATLGVGTPRAQQMSLLCHDIDAPTQPRPAKLLWPSEQKENLLSWFSSHDSVGQLYRVWWSEAFAKRLFYPFDTLLQIEFWLAPIWIETRCFSSKLYSKDPRLFGAGGAVGEVRALLWREGRVMDRQQRFSFALGCSHVCFYESLFSGKTSIDPAQPCKIGLSFWPETTSDKPPSFDARIYLQKSDKLCCRWFF